MISAICSTAAVAMMLGALITKDVIGMGSAIVWALLAVATSKDMEN